MIPRPHRRASLWVGAWLSTLLAARSVAAAQPPEAGRSEPAASSSTPAVNDRLVLTRVVPNDNRVAARLGAELDVIGLEAESIEIEPGAPPIGADLLDRVEAAGATAAIEIVISSNRIEVWVADANTGKTLTRRFDLAIDPGQAEPRTLAIAAVELLRASRLELEVKPPEPADQAHEDERPPESEGSTEIPFGGAFSLGAVFGGSPGGLGLTGHVEIAGRWAPPLRRFGLRASAWLPTLGNRVGDERGEARVLTLLAFVEPQLRLPGGAPWFHPELGLGLGVAITILQGQAALGLRNNQDVLTGFAAHGHVGLGFELIPRLWLRLDGYVGIVQPQPRILFVTDVVARWGLPFGAGAAALEVWF